MRSQRRIERLSNAIHHTQPDLTIVLENIHDPHNVSAIMRTCDAVGVRKINLLYTAEKFPKVGKKSSASAYKWIEYVKFKSLSDCYETLKAEGFLIAASVVDSKSVSLYDLNMNEKTALVFGNEHRGVSEKAATNADVMFQIPMFGMVQSLNVSVACAVTLYEAFRQRMTSGVFEKLKIDDAEFKKQLNEWERK